MIKYATNWRTAGACLTADPDLFFPIAVGDVATKEVARAQRICESCPVKQQCLDFAMQTREPTGIWGGTTPEERIRVLRGRHRRPSHRTAHELSESRAS